MAKETVSNESKVKLYSAELDETREHGIEHANRIFKYKHAHGWELKDDNYELNKNGIITKRDTKKAQGAGEQESA